MKHRRLFLLLLALVLFSWACSHNVTVQSRVPAVKAGGSMSQKPAIKLQLSPGNAEQASIPSIKTTASVPLGEAETQALLKRLPAFKAGQGQAQEFAKRSESLPAPRTGVTVKESFPAATELAPPPAAVANTDELKVVRFSPEGEVPLAPQVSLTFSLPMVAVTSQQQASAVVPAVISPQCPGKWRWVGAKTALFEADGERLPQAQEYKVVVPAGTKSVNGKALKEDFTFTFKTPPLSLVGHYPTYGSQKRDTYMALVFDQTVNPQQLLPFLQVKAGLSSCNFALASAQEIANNKTLSAAIQDYQPRRLTVIKPIGNLPYDSQIEVTLKAGAPSAEGKRLTEKDLSYNFRTYGPMEVEDYHCGWDKEPPPPGTPWTIEFTNDIDEDQADIESFLQVSPSVDNMRVSVSGRRLVIAGNTKGNTKYTVIMKSGVPDIYGQTLESDYRMSFKMGRSEPFLKLASDKRMVVLDPSPGKSELSVYSINEPKFRAKLYKVTPKDWRQYCDWASHSFYYDAKNITNPPGQCVFNGDIRTANPADEFVETRINLSPALENGLGHVIVVVEAPPTKYEHHRRYFVWIQVTKLGVEAVADSDNLHVVVSSLNDGSPVAGAHIDFLGASAQATTAADGTAVIDAEQLAPHNSEREEQVLLARFGQDVVMLPGDGSRDNFRMPADSGKLLWFVFDDRGIYKPGETFHVKGWVRNFPAGPHAQLEAMPAQSSLTWKLLDARYNEIASGTVNLNSFGAFDFKGQIPDKANLGEAKLRLEASPLKMGNRVKSQSLQIQEFRRPEFEVSASAASGDHFFGDTIPVTAKASYYAGGALPGAPVKWTVKASPSTYAPPGWEGYIFGAWRPWWNCGWFLSRDNTQVTENLSGSTDSLGKNVANLKITELEPPLPLSLTASAAVSDVNQQTWAAKASVLVHPASLYVGLKPLRTFVEAGQPLRLQVIAANIDGKLQSGTKVSLRSACLEHTWRQGELREKELDVQQQQVTVGSQALDVAIKPNKSGPYRVEATACDAQGRRTMTKLVVWVAGGILPRNDSVEADAAELIPDKKEYQVNDIAEVLVQSPFYPAHGTAVLARQGIVETQRFTMTGPSYTLKIPIKEAYLPNLSVAVTLDGAQTRSDKSGQLNNKLPKRPAYATGKLDLQISPLKRALHVSIQPAQSRLEPGGATELLLSVKDANQQPLANGEIAIVAADEAVLALTGHTIGDPLQAFYPNTSDGITSWNLRRYVTLKTPELKAEQGVQEDAVFCLESAGVMTNAAPGAMPLMKAAAPRVAAVGAPRAAAQQQPIALRSNFDPLALFAASVKTDAAGQARVKLQLPDNLTRYRIVAVAVDRSQRFGRGETSVLARLPLMVRPSLPRFLNFGDKVSLPVVIQNQTDQTLTVDLAARARNLKLLQSGCQVSVPANDRCQVLLPAEALEAGEAAVQIAVQSGNYADATDALFPVWTPCTSEAFATYGQIDQGAVKQPIQRPQEVWPQFGGLEITTSSTALQELTDAVIYLTDYKFDCAEQISSRVIALCALRDVLASFKAETLPTPARMQIQVKQDLQRLSRLQASDGGFSLWRSGGREYPYVSVHCANAMIQAEAKGYEVSQRTKTRALSYLDNIKKHIPAEYSPKTRAAIEAYALNVLYQSGQSKAEDARALVKQYGCDGLSMESLGWLLPILSKDSASATEVQAIRTYLSNHVTETAEAANFADSYGEEQGYLLMASNRRADGILLSAYLVDQPNSELIPKLVRGLLKHRVRGHWNNTQENVFILLALDKYFQTFEKVTPDFTARIWLGSTYAAEHTFKGRETTYRQTEVPMRELSDTSSQPLIMQKDGQGRLYYRVGMRYAPKDLNLKAADYGFTIERTYEGVDHPDDVKCVDGVWHIKYGSRVRSKITMVAPSRRYHVALVDPLPAGFEALNSALKVTEEVPGKASELNKRPWYMWLYRWYEHENLRDERAEAFATLLWEGVYSYEYVCRATTPGHFVVPPAKAEEMYSPEVFGRSHSDRVIIK